jgi:predicted protein tyrosine phosphatase
MNIQIFSAEAAAKEIRASSKKWHVISIRDCRHSVAEHPVDFVEENCDRILITRFDDITWSTNPGLGYTSPKKEDIADIFHWVETNRPVNLMVHCWAGVARSSAVAFMLSCKYNSAEEAFNLLDPDRHQPNVMVMDFGLDLLSDTEANRYYRKFILSQSP